MIVTKILVFLLVFAILNVLVNIWDFIKAFINSEKFEKPLWEIICLGVSISYIMTIICTGFEL